MAHLLRTPDVQGSPSTRRCGPSSANVACAPTARRATTTRTNFASFAADDDNLKWYLDWQADAMVNSFIARKDLDTRMTVVRNELEARRERPAAHHVAARHGRTVRLAQTTARSRSAPAYCRVDIERLPRRNYHHYYQPTTRPVVLRPLRSAAGARLGAGLVRQDPGTCTGCQPLYTLEPVQDGERTYHRPGAAAWRADAAASYHAPAASHPDYAAAEVLANILLDEPSGGSTSNSSRKGLAASVRGLTWDLADPGAMMFGAQLAPGQDVDAARRRCSRRSRLCREADRCRGSQRAKKRWSTSGAAFHQPGDGRVALSNAVGQGRLAVLPAARPRPRRSRQPTLSASRRASSSRQPRPRHPIVPTEAPVRAGARPCRRRRRAQGHGAIRRCSRPGLQAPRQRTSTRTRFDLLRPEGRPVAQERCGRSHRGRR